MGHDAWRSDLRHSRRSSATAAGGDYATALQREKGNTPGTIILSTKTIRSRPDLAQIDGIFGLNARRLGGHALVHEERAGSEGNIRTWGQLGLGGDWADQPIHIYGIDATLSNWSEMIQKLASRAGQWNSAIRES